MGKKGRTFAGLHILLMIYSIGGILSKLAAREKFMSTKFCAYYIGLIALLGIYAIGWQQVIKRLSLTTAFANKAITVVWGIIWGMTIFHETITPGQLMGAALVACGVMLYARADEHETQELTK